MNKPPNELLFTIDDHCNTSDRFALYTTSRLLRCITRLNDFKHISWIWDLASHGRSQFIQFLLHAVLTRLDTISHWEHDFRCNGLLRGSCQMWSGEACSKAATIFKYTNSQGAHKRPSSNKTCRPRTHTSLGVWLAGRSNRSIHCNSPAKISAAEMDMI